MTSQLDSAYIAEDMISLPDAKSLDIADIVSIVGRIVLVVRKYV